MKNSCRKLVPFQVISKFRRRSPTFLHSLTESSPVAIDEDSKPDCAVPVSHDEHVESCNQKLADVLNDREFNITPHLKPALIAVIDRCLDDISADADDPRRRTVVEHSIITRDAHPIKEKL